MNRPLAVIVLLGFANLGWSQDGPAGRAALVDQFDGKELHGWEIDGEGKIEGGFIKLGGAAEAKLRLLTPLGDHIRLRLEYQLGAGPGMPALHWEADGNTQGVFGFSAKGQWMELDATGQRNGFWGQYRLNLADGKIPGPNEGNSGMFADVGGRVCRFAIHVPAGASLTIRKIALGTTAPPPTTRSPGFAIVVMALLLAGVIALGWLLNRRRGASSAAAKP